MKSIFALMLAFGLNASAVESFNQLYCSGHIGAEKVDQTLPLNRGESSELNLPTVQGKYYMVRAVSDYGVPGITISMGSKTKDGSWEGASMIFFHAQGPSLFYIDNPARVLLNCVLRNSQ